MWLDPGPLHSEDGKGYKRWKLWCCNKLLALDKLPEASRGPYIYTLLSGKGLEVVEHLEPSAYQKSGGDSVIWALLDQRFLQKEQVDELGEILGEVFALRVKDGESMKMWAARSQELFERCARKTGLKFPEEARGWLMLHRAGLSEEQKAVVIARAGGDLNLEKISTSLRSCYPDFTAGEYQIAEESIVLQNQAAEKQQRLLRKQALLQIPEKTK